MLIQVQWQDSMEWETIETADLSPMRTFGYRQRLDRILQETHGKNVAEAVRQRLALWVAECSEPLHPHQRKVVAVRFGAVVWPANFPALAQPSGHWLSDAPLNPSTPPFILLSAFALNQGKAQPMAKPTHVKPSVTKPPVSNQVPPVFRRNRPTTPAATSSETVPPTLTPSPPSKTP